MLEVGVDTKSEVDRLRAIAQRATDIKPVAARLYALAEQDFAQRFTSSPSVETTAQVYGGVTWARLSEAYLKSRPTRRGGKQLIVTGETRDSFKLGKPGNVAIATPEMVEFGSNLPKAVWLNEKRNLAPMHPLLAAQASALMEKYVIRGKK